MGEGAECVPPGVALGIGDGAECVPPGVALGIGLTPGNAPLPGFAGVALGIGDGAECVPPGVALGIGLTPIPGKVWICLPLSRSFWEAAAMACVRLFAPMVPWPNTAAG
jgi:hypothetical protein